MIHRSAQHVWASTSSTYLLLCPPPRLRSAYSAVPPIAMQKSYTLPRAVCALHHTVTAHGLSNKDLLVGLRNGQVYSIDVKQQHSSATVGVTGLEMNTKGGRNTNAILVLV
eukprot:gene11728-13618_t